MASNDAYEITPGINLLERPTNFKTDGDSMRIQLEEVSNEIKTTNHLVSSDEKITKQPRKCRSRTLKIKPDGLLTSQMVMEAFKVLNKRNGISEMAILEYIGCHYRVDPKFIKRQVTRFLHTASQKGIIQKLSGEGDLGRFKIKIAEKVHKVGQSSEEGDDGRSKIKKAKKVAKVRQVGGMGEDRRPKNKIVENVIKAGRLSIVGDNRRFKIKKAKKIAKIRQVSGLGEDSRSKNKRTGKVGKARQLSREDDGQSKIKKAKMVPEERQVSGIEEDRRTKNKSAEKVARLTVKKVNAQMHICFSTE